MRWLPIVLLISLVLVPAVAVAQEAVYTLNEDSTYQTGETLTDLWGLQNDTVIFLTSPCDDVIVVLVDGYLNITSSNDWNGECWVSFGYSQEGIASDGAFLVNVTNVNDGPIIHDILLNGDQDNLANPVTAVLNYSDIDGDDMDITWYLDGEEISKGETFQRYIYPDQNNLTVIINDGNGGIDSDTITINTIPPEGWGDEPDNNRNRIVFWIIFGSGGLILLAAMVWVLFKPQRKEQPGEMDK